MSNVDECLHACLRNIMCVSNFIAPVCGHQHPVVFTAWKRPFGLCFLRSGTTISYLVAM